ncbi:hypothetical protein BGZ95_000937 [Linnemannia exigua]|uniref:Uncharacterized protein n=1 Tax=Linnemannia exigua TaxID=604196 RepID=A0AAD4H402_9FUNG|nr:hypothetical protein BGZ95_000937 [Linnemannia exigua]
MYTTNNFRYLRISKHSVLPLNLLLSKDDLAWFNDYSFQEILTVLKPILLGQVELFNQGHITKRTINPVASSNSEDGLEDAGVLLGGEQSEDPDTKRTKRRNAAAERPQFGVRYGLRTHTPSERGGAVLIANKNLGFTRVKTEEDVALGNELGQGESNQSQGSSGRRTSMGLASLEGEAPVDDGGPVVIREEDESENLRVSDFQQGDERELDVAVDGDYQDESASQCRGASKRKSSGSATQGRAKGKRAKATNESHQLPSQSDQKPTLQVSYGAMKLHPQTLYIVVRSVDSGLPSLSSILPFTSPVESTRASDKKESTAAATITTETASSPQEDEDSLFPPGLDYFIDS